MNTAIVFDFCLVARTFGLQVGSVAVEDIHILFADVDMREEVVPHKTMVTLGVVFGQADILVHIECYHVAERHFARAVEFYQMAVHTERRRAGGQTEHERCALFGRELVDTTGYIVGCPTAEQFIIGLNDNTHCFS